ncbi:hypothetical protein CesoFtcFv8_004657 [Champsocephalus esox]|uniref:Uncharacterized protein n=1 Tax=Champsocephalus esox TaxID=159716 RepID=A0AAN8H8W7_9TELE|nr:hypothetical protein CesoFtcFv8_004657 [Champsocephalus esox]
MLSRQAALTEEDVLSLEEVLLRVFLLLFVDLCDSSEFLFPLFLSLASEVMLMLAGVDAPATSVEEDEPLKV